MVLQRDKINKFFIIFLLSQPMIDLITSLCISFFDFNISVGMVIRALFLGICIVYLIFYSKHKDRDKYIFYIKIIGLYMFAYIINNLVLKGSPSIFVEFKSLLKIFYFPILLLVIRDAMDKRLIKINAKFLVQIAFIYTVIIFIAQLTGTQFVTYSSGKLGHVGWFYSPNEIGAILAIIAPLVIYDAVRSRQRLGYYAFLFIYLCAIFIIGTKVPFLGLVVTILSFILLYIIKMYVEKKNYVGILVLPLIAAMITTIVIAPNTPIGYNLNLHLQWLQIKNIDELYRPNNKEKLINLVFSSRDIYLKKVIAQYKNASISEKLIGLGYSDTDGNQIKIVEMDYYDVFYRNGILGFILIFTPFLLALWRIIQKIAKNAKKIMLDLDNMEYIVGILLALFTAFFAGHVIVAPAVSIYIVLQTLMLEKRLKKV